MSRNELRFFGILVRADYDWDVPGFARALVLAANVKQ